MTSYLLGRKIRLTVTITSVATGAAADPDNLTLTIRNRDTSINTAYVYGTDAEIVKSATGIYYCDITPAADGNYSYRWSCTGTITDAVEDQYSIEPSEVV